MKWMWCSLRCAMRRTLQWTQHTIYRQIQISPGAILHGCDALRMQPGGSHVCGPKERGPPMRLGPYDLTGAGKRVDFQVHITSYHITVLSLPLPLPLRLLSSVHACILDLPLLYAISGLRECDDSRQAGQHGANTHRPGACSTALCRSLSQRVVPGLHAAHP